MRTPNQAASLERRDCTAISFRRHWRGVGEPQRGMKRLAPFILGAVLVSTGCSRSPSVVPSTSPPSGGPAASPSTASGPHSGMIGSPFRLMPYEKQISWMKALAETQCLARCISAFEAGDKDKAITEYRRTIGQASNFASAMTDLNTDNFSNQTLEDYNSRLMGVMFGMSLLMNGDAK